MWSVPVPAFTKEVARLLPPAVRSVPIFVISLKEEESL